MSKDKELVMKCMSLSTPLQSAIIIKSKRKVTDELGYRLNVSSNIFIQNGEDHEFVKEFKG